MDASETEAQQRCVAMPSYSPGIACGQTKYGFRTGLTCLVLPKRPPCGKSEGWRILHDPDPFVFDELRAANVNAS